MKNFRLLMTAPLVVLMLAFFASASQAQKSDQLVGNWKGTDVVATPLKKDAGINPALFEKGKKEHQSTRYELKADGTMTVSSSAGTQTGNWKLNGKYLETSGLGKMRIAQLANGKMSLSTWVSLRTGQAVSDKKDADFELVYVFSK